MKINKRAETKLDWLTLIYTVTNVEMLLEILENLGLQDKGNFIWTSRANLYTYERCYELAESSIIIGFKKYNGIIEMMIQFSGNGLAVYHNKVLFDREIDIVFKLKEQLEKYHVSVSRIDIATDFYNYDYHFSPLYLYGESKYHNNLITSARTVKFIDSYSSKGVKYEPNDFITNSSSVKEGATLYIGKNPKQLRIYNKKAEREQRFGIKVQEKSWYRWEYQLNGIHADNFIEELKNQSYKLGQTWVNFLKSDVRFIEHIGHQEKKSRYPNAKWFEELISAANVEKIQKCTQYRNDNLQKSYRWIMNGGPAKTLRNLVEYEKRRLLSTARTSDEEEAFKMALDFVTTQLLEISLNGMKVDEALQDKWTNF